MNFLGIGPFELLLILVIATIVLGPERMAQAGRTLGRLYGQYRIRWQKDVDEMTRELRRELEMLQHEVEEIRQSAESEITAAQTALEGVLGTEIDLGLDPATPKAGDATSGARSDAQPNDEIAPLAPEQERASDGEDPTAAMASSTDDRVPASDAPDPLAVNSSPIENTDDSSVEGDSEPDIGSPSSAQALAAEEQETVHATESLAEAAETPAVPSETREVEGDHS
jgi:Sec-independent protein translocase protein TatA